MLKKLREMKLGTNVDHAHSISIDGLGEKYYLMIVIDGVDFVWSQTCQVRTNPEDLLHEFLTMSHLKISTICFDAASEFGKTSSFIVYHTQHDIVRESLVSYTHIQNARVEGATRICDQKITFGAFSAVPTCLEDSGLIHCVTSTVSTLIGLMSTACRCGKSLIVFSLTRCVTIW